MSTTHDHGTYLEVDGRAAVRFVRHYPYAVDKVWAAVTDPAQLAVWFPSQVALDPRVGGAMNFTGDPYAPDGAGTVTVWDPPHRLTFTWYDDELRLEVTATDDGCTLTLIDVLEAANAAARNAAGWDDCLAGLDALLADRPPPGGSMNDWRGLYEQYVAAGLPAGAEVPDLAQQPG